MVAVLYYLERENYKVLDFQVNNSFYFEISASLQQVPPSNKRSILKLRKYDNNS